MIKSGVVTIIFIGIFKSPVNLKFDAVSLIKGYTPALLLLNI